MAYTRAYGRQREGSLASNKRGGCAFAGEQNQRGKPCRFVKLLQGASRMHAAKLFLQGLLMQRYAPCSHASGCPGAGVGCKEVQGLETLLYCGAQSGGRGSGMVVDCDRGAGSFL